METKAKAVNDLPETVVLKDMLLTISVCAAIPPDRETELPDKIFSAFGGNGTAAGKWHLADYEQYPELKPIPCDDYESRWHYVLFA